MNAKFSQNKNIISALVLVVVITLGVYFSTRVKIPSNAPQVSQGSKFKLLSGSQTYQIVQAAEKRPQIIEATINPPDVHVGDKQTLSIIVSDPDGIASVEAQIQTDHSTITLPLNYVRVVADSEITPSAYSVDANNHLVINDALHSGLASLLDSRFWIPDSSPVHASGPQKLLYEASWTVKDTHDTTYHTTFIAKNVKGDLNSITLAWSDACSIPNSGSWTIGANCTISSVDGPDNGTTTIATYTLTLNSTFAFNPGKSILLNSGSIAIGAGGQLKQTYLWRNDADADTYPAVGTLAQDTTPGGNWTRRYLYGGNADDCYDSNLNAFPGETTFFGIQRGDGSFDYNCDSTEEGDRNGLYVLLCSSVPTCATIEVAGWDTTEPSCGTNGAWDPGGGSCSYDSGSNTCFKSHPESTQIGPRYCR